MKHEAHLAVNRAIRAGFLRPPSHCMNCKEPATQRLDAHHHNGYDEEHWLDVIWLCKHCHGILHSGRVRREVQAYIAAIAMAALTPEERSARARLGGDRAAAANLRWLTATDEDRTMNAQRGWATRRARGADASASARKGWETRRAKG